MTAAEPGPLLTFGETLAVLRADRPGPLERGHPMRLSVAGSESNVAIGVSRLGHPAAFVGRVGADSLGEMVRSALLGAGVTAHLFADRTRRTGLMLVEQRMHDVRRVDYYRRDSAGSALTPDDVDPRSVAAAGLVHVTGITAVLSESTAATVSTSVALARTHGVPVSLDLNYRSALMSPPRFRSAVEPLLAESDIVFASLDEARLILGANDTGDAETLLSRLPAATPAEIVLTDGRNGAWAATATEARRQLALPVDAIDPIGAGDAFVAGYLAARLQGKPMAERLSWAVRVAAVCVATVGDWEGLPRADELPLLDLGHGAVSR